MCLSKTSKIYLDMTVWQSGNSLFSLYLSSLQLFRFFLSLYYLSLQNFSSKENYWSKREEKKLLEICKFGRTPTHPTPVFPVNIDFSLICAHSHFMLLSHVKYNQCLLIMWIWCRPPLYIAVTFSHLNFLIQITQKPPSGTKQNWAKPISFIFCKTPKNMLYRMLCKYSLSHQSFKDYKIFIFNVS